MNRRLALAIALVAGAVACKSSAPSGGARFLEPSAVATFEGITIAHPGEVRPYVAVANAGRGDVTLLDAVDDTPVPGPGLVRALAVPTIGARPIQLVSSSLHDDPALGALPDLLVVVGAGSSLLELVRTWSADGVVEVLPVPSTAPPQPTPQSVDLATDLAGADVLALVAAPVPDATQASGVAAGKTRVVAALSDGKLAVVEYARGADGQSIVVSGATVQTLEFQPLALAVNPEDPAHVYAATVDALPGAVHGVAELDATGTPGSWTVRAIDARGPTRLVAAATVAERKADSAGDFPTGDPTTSPFEPPARRVYAYLDPSGCGASARVPCGIAVLDPVAGAMVPDYAGDMPYLAPIAFNSVAIAMAISRPPKVAINAASTTDVSDTLSGDFMKIAPGTGARGTSAVMAIAAADGLVYVVDLSRWAVPSDTTVIRRNTASTTGTRVSGMAAGAAVFNVTEGGVTKSHVQQLGLWSMQAVVPPATAVLQLYVTAAGDILQDLVRITPGYTPTETWTIEYQGFLPSLGSRRAVADATSDGRTSIAVQVPDSSGSGPVATSVARLWDPTLGVHVGDIVVVDATSVAACGAASGTTFNVEAVITALLPPDPAHPGGSVAVEENPGQTLPAGCFAGAVEPGRTFTSTFLSGGMLLTGASLGYGGRPALVTDPKTQPAYALQYSDEDVLAASCPLLPWPAQLPAAGDPFYACADEACRAPCEALVLARKARRIYHVSDVCGAVDTTKCSQDWAGVPFPRATGPVVRFQVGLQETLYGTTTAATPTPPQRGLTLNVDTIDSVTFMSRRPPPGSGDAVLPTGGMATFDRSVIPGHEADSYRFYVSYGGDMVLDFTPAQASTAPVVVR
jgi:hypothetical protein